MNVRHTTNKTVMPSPPYEGATHMLLRRLQTMIDRDARTLVWVRVTCHCQTHATGITRGAIRCRHQGTWVQVPLAPLRLRS